MVARSEASHKAILEATMELLDEGQHEALTVQKLSIERIARQAGVSKTTIYRWWPSKVAVVIDTFLDKHIARTAVREDIPVLDALSEHHASLAALYAGHEGRLMAQLIAECQYDSSAMADFKERFFRPRVAVSTRLIERAMAEGSIRDDLAPRDVAELMYAPIYFRLLFADGPLDAQAAARMLDAALDGVRVRTA